MKVTKFTKLKKGDIVYVANVLIDTELNNPLSTRCEKQILEKEISPNFFDGCSICDITKMIVIHVGDSILAKRKYFEGFLIEEYEDFNLNRLIDAGHVFTTIGEACFFSISRYIDFIELDVEKNKKLKFQFADDLNASCLRSSNLNFNSPMTLILHISSESKKTKERNEEG